MHKVLLSIMAVIILTLDGWGIWIIHHWPQYTVNNILFGLVMLCCSCAVFTFIYFAWTGKISVS